MCFRKQIYISIFHHFTEMAQASYVHIFVCICINLRSEAPRMNSVGGGRGAEMEVWLTGSVTGSVQKARAEMKGGGGRRGHRVVGGRDAGLVPKGGGGGGGGVGPVGRSVATGLGRKPVRGCYSAEMRRPAIRTTAHDPCSGQGCQRPWPWVFQGQISK